MNSILLVSPTAKLGGAERILYSIAVFLAKKGFDVTFIIMSKGPQAGWEEAEKMSNLQVIALNHSSEKRALPFLIWHIFRLSQENKFDFALSSHTHINALLSFLRGVGLVRVRYLIGRESTFIFERFSGYYRCVFAFLYRFFYGNHDVLICQTEKMKESLEFALGFSPAKKVVVIRNPVDLDRILIQLQHRQISVDESKKNLVACGRLVPIKGFDVLIESFAKLVKAGLEANLTIIGDGPEKVRLAALADSLGIKNYVYFAGFQNNPAIWFSVADVGVVSSEREGFPNVILEMMASGVKSIVTTPCTDGLDDLPGVIVADLFSVDSLGIALQYAVRSNQDFSRIYRAHVKHCRSLVSFWNQVESSLDINSG